MGGGGGGGGGEGLRSTLANDCCANLIIGTCSHAYVNSYIGKVVNRLKNQAHIRLKMAKTPFSQRSVANS